METRGLRETRNFRRALNQVKKDKYISFSLLNPVHTFVINDFTEIPINGKEFIVVELIDFLENGAKIPFVFKTVLPRKLKLNDEMKETIRRTFGREKIVLDLDGNIRKENVSILANLENKIGKIEMKKINLEYLKPSPSCTSQLIDQKLTKERKKFDPKEKIFCECGRTYTRRNKCRHIKRWHNQERNAASHNTSPKETRATYNPNEIVECELCTERKTYTRRNRSRHMKKYH